MRSSGLSYLFIGPTAPDFSDFRFVVLPPAKRGDVLKLLPTEPSRIVLVDGFFGQQAAVMHRELLMAVETGTTVIGCSSMGALRAAELRAFGMYGCGVIFDAFCRGSIKCDDEVALLHAPREFRYQAITFPLCNLRATIKKLIANTPARSRKLLAILTYASSLPYTERTLENIDRFANRLCGKTEAHKLMGDIENAWVDQKRADFFETVASLAEFPPPSKACCSKRLPETTWLNFHKSRTCEIVEDVPEILLHAVVRFYDTEFFVELAVNCLIDSILKNFADKSQNVAGHKADSSNDDSPEALLLAYQERWKQADVNDAIGALVNLKPKATLNDWLDTPPLALQPATVRAWALSTPRVVRLAMDAYKGSGRHKPAVDIAASIHRFTQVVRHSTTGASPRNISARFLRDSLLLQRGKPSSDLSLTSLMMGFCDPDEMIDLYREIVLFELCFQFDGMQPWQPGKSCSIDYFDYLERCFLSQASTDYQRQTRWLYNNV